MTISGNSIGSSFSLSGGGVSVFLTVVSPPTKHLSETLTIMVKNVMHKLLIPIKNSN